MVAKGFVEEGVAGVELEAAEEDNAKYTLRNLLCYLQMYKMKKLHLRKLIQQIQLH